MIDGSHIKPHGIARSDQQHATLRLRVRADGGLFGDPGDGTAKHYGIGLYFVTFDRTAMTDEVTATKSNPRWLDDCAVVATPRVGGSPLSPAGRTSRWSRCAARAPER